MSVMERLRERAEGGARVGDLLDETLEETGYLEALAGRAHDRGAGPAREPRGARGVAREYDATAEEADSVEEFLQQIALFSEQDDLRDDEGIVTLMTLHNAKGLESPIVFIIGMEDGVFPHIALDRGGRPRGGAPALLRRHHARQAQLYLTYARDPALFGAPRLEPAEPLHRRDPAELTDATRRRSPGRPRRPRREWGASAPEPPRPGARTRRLVRARRRRGPRAASATAS